MKTWLVVLALLATHHVTRAQEPAPGPRAVAARRVLDTKKVSARFERVTLEDCVTFLHDTAGIDVVVLPRARELATEGTVSLRVRDITVRSCIELIVGQLGAHQLRWTLYRGVVLVGHVWELPERQALRFYDTNELAPVPDFPAPDAGFFVPDGEPARAILPEPFWECCDA